MIGIYSLWCLLQFKNISLLGSKHQYKVSEIVLYVRNMNCNKLTGSYSTKNGIVILTKAVTRFLARFPRIVNKIDGSPSHHYSVF
jgi:hypothetical protein